MTAAIIPLLTAIAPVLLNQMMNSGGDEYSQHSRLNKKQKPILDQLTNAVQNPGAGGAFGASADYYRDLMSNDSKTMEQLSAPELRRFNEDIIPGLSEQFAGMGAGGLSSSGFQNAAVNAGTDLSERLGAIRAGLRQQGAQGLQNLGAQSLDDYTINHYQRPDQGGWEDLANTGIKAATSYVADKYGQPSQQPLAATVPGTNIPSGGGLPNFSANSKIGISGKGKSGPYGKTPGMGQPLPNFQTQIGMR